VKGIGSFAIVTLSSSKSNGGLEVVDLSELRRTWCIL